MGHFRNKIDGRILQVMILTNKIFKNELDKTNAQDTEGLLSGQAQFREN